mgnify:CR=1 FL=1
MATSSSLATPVSPIAVVGRAPARKKSYNPTVMAILQGNRMRECEDVIDLHAQCLATGSSASICKTAAHYMNACVNTR